MQHGWSGGQYSVWRFALGLGLIELFAGPLVGRPPAGHPLIWLPAWSEAGWAPWWALAGCLCASLLALGRWDRIAAWCLFFLLPWHGEGAIWSSLISPLHLLLGLHLFLPPAPYGSLAAAGRPDPDGEWHLPDKAYALVHVFLAAPAHQRFEAAARRLPWPSSKFAGQLMQG